MKNITYGIVKEIYILNQMSRTSYGIVAYSCSEDEGTANIITSVHDVTSDRNSIEKLISLCNSLQLSAIHLDDIVEDFFAI